MTLHLVKLCVGANGVDDLRAWIKKRVQANIKTGMGRCHDHVTRMHPRRADELLNGGSIYWVIKGVILSRQKIIGFEKRIGQDQIERTAILFDPALVLTAPSPRRAFQGWRYLQDREAPRDIEASSQKKSPPPELALELAELGLL
ncbi:DUF1489 domain-containing protein [Hyphococcus flavus]|uniref:DUF1489 domain-containing protein n=1 Tax=Hyphococcus flavus TaxID=1866326 RepID=A0AAE9ZCB0_9PROT|nr:DUF1489 domain-containing protein [Hyphococcus flavus]WDI31786.1 DUF1489 domain-containing protein [Hyphococcus flavus]